MNNKILYINKRGLRVDFNWLPLLESILYRRFKQLSKLKSKRQAISIALVSANEIKGLNRVYRQTNKITDVLSFNIDSDKILGEVVICLTRARQQAKQQQHSLKTELQQLTIHGIMHLLGYDHTKSQSAAKRQASLEQEILSLLK